MNILDRFIDAFSARDLKSRVRGVIVFGLILLAATAAGGVWFLGSTHTIAVEGTAIWSDAASGILTATLSAADLERIPPEEPLAVECLATGKEPARSPAMILDLEPSALTMRLQATEIPADRRTPGRFAIRLILVEEPYGKMLWGR